MRLVLLLSLTFATLLICGAAQEKKVVRTPSPRPTAAVDGKTLFSQYCAVCHGADGRGAGPAAATLKQQPTDLTQIGSRNNGKFPEDKMLRILKGEESIPSHGTVEMPIWGPAFYGMSSNLSLGQTRIHSLVNFLEELQTK